MDGRIGTLDTPVSTMGAAGRQRAIVGVINYASAAKGAADFEFGIAAAE